MDTENKLKKYEQWLVTLKILTAACFILSIILIYFAVKGKVDPILLILALMSTLMFFMAYREKSKGPRPGSPEYEAIERAHEAKIAAQKERIYRKQHPFDVARELVANNKASSKSSENKTDSSTKKDA